jgi:hypothetical protein
MRAYKFLDDKYGIDSLRSRRLKQSRVADLNDPFELTPYDITDYTLRMAFLKTRADVDKNRGLLCFSAYWKNPVIWAHYSDKHKGLCLGFELPELNDDPKSNTGRVTYLPKLLPFPTNFEQMSDREHDAFARGAIFTKFEHWIYEEEIRVWGPLENEESGLYFVPFGKDLQLAEVIVGQRCTVSKAEIVSALGSLAGKVKISRARAACDKFEMVEDQGSW